MCGRFAFYSPSEATAALFGVDGSIAVEPRYNIAPTQFIAAVREDEEQNRELVMLRWGLVPFWAKDPAIGNRMINARAETVAERPSYRAAFQHRRCLVLADGFYEWRKEGNTKTPYFISLASGKPFGLAGLWENWTDKNSGESIQSTTLITTAANEWLSRPGDFLERSAASSPALQAWPVDRRINNARNSGAELIAATGDILS